VPHVDLVYLYMYRQRITSTVFCTSILQPASDLALDGYLRKVLEFVEVNHD
jgi:hypothetical protein